MGGSLRLTARLHVCYPTVPTVFCDSRKLAEDFTRRFLAAASDGEQLNASELLRSGAMPDGFGLDLDR